MIIGNENKPTILDKLNSSPIVFYPTGSRFFGNTHPNSDYDFFTLKNTYTENFLYELGFHRISHARYKDASTTDVFRHYEGKIQIDVQFVVNPVMKSGIQEQFKKSGILDPTTEMWNVAAMFYTEPQKQRLDPAFAFHKFDNMIQAIKFIRENYKIFELATGEYRTPGLVDVKRLVESVMVMAQRS